MTEMDRWDARNNSLESSIEKWMGETKTTQVPMNMLLVICKLYI